MINRMHLRSGAALVATVMLGSCGRGGGAVVAMEPGQWEMTMRVTNVQMDNMPPEMRDNMRGMANQSRTASNCMAATADVIRIENLRFTVPQPAGRPAAGCHIAELSMESGRIRGELSCEGIPSPAGQTVSMTGEMNGTYSANTMDITMRGGARSGQNSGSAELRITGRRTGACPPPPVYTPAPYAPPVVDTPPVYPPAPPAPPMAVPDRNTPPSGNTTGM